MTGAAPKVFVSYAHDSPEHKERVRKLATLLRARVGMEVHLDQWYDHKRQDWAAWATDQLTYSDFVIVVASPLYGAGPGSQFEEYIIRDLLTKDLRAATEKVLPVVLAGGSIEDIPAYLAPHSTTRFEISTIDEEGIQDLLAAITGQAEHPMPERGRWKSGGPRERATVAEELHRLSDSGDVRTGEVSIGGNVYEHSIFVRAGSPVRAGSTVRAGSPVRERSFAEIGLGGGYTRFTAVAGMLDDALEPFQVGRFAVYGDGELRAEFRVSYEKPAVVAVDVTGVMKMRLEMWREPVPSSPFAGRRVRGHGRAAELGWGEPVVT